MTGKMWMLLLICALVAALAYADAHSYRPKNGFVPDEKTAVRIAEAVLTPIYGDEAVIAQRPFSAKLRGTTWVVTGSLPDNQVGGVAEVRISKRTGEILQVTHTR